MLSAPSRGAEGGIGGMIGGGSGGYPSILTSAPLSSTHTISPPQNHNTHTGASGAASAGATAAAMGGGSGAAVAVHDVSWAPKMGRSYHAIATAGRDGHIRVYYLRWVDVGVGGWVGSGTKP